MPPFLLMIVGSLVRHALTAGGALAVADAVAPAAVSAPTDEAQAIAGAVATLAGLLWSAWQKHRAAK